MSSRDDSCVIRYAAQADDYFKFRCRFHVLSRDTASLRQSTGVLILLYSKATSKQNILGHANMYISEHYNVRRFEGARLP